MRFLFPTIVTKVGETVEWTNLDPTLPHTVTFGTEPDNVFPPSVDVTVDADGVRHATLGAPGSSTNSGIIAATSEDRFGRDPEPVPGTRFRVTFTRPGTFDYICGLHDEIGMKGKVVVLPQH